MDVLFSNWLGDAVFVIGRLSDTLSVDRGVLPLRDAQLKVRANVRYIEERERESLGISPSRRFPTRIRILHASSYFLCVPRLTIY